MSDHPMLASRPLRRKTLLEMAMHSSSESSDAEDVGSMSPAPRARAENAASEGAASSARARRGRAASWGSSPSSLEGCVDVPLISPPLPADDFDNGTSPEGATTGTLDLGFCPFCGAEFRTVRERWSFCDHLGSADTPGRPKLSDRLAFYRLTVAAPALHLPLVSERAPPSFATFGLRSAATRFTTRVALSGWS